MRKYDKYDYDGIYRTKQYPRDHWEYEKIGDRMTEAEYRSALAILNASSSVYSTSSQQKASKPAPPAAPKPAPAPPPKVKLSHTKRLWEDQMELLSQSRSPLVEKMFRNMLAYSNMRSVPLEWLDRSCKGFYFIDDNHFRILFEEEDDMVLFKVAFEGTESA